MNTNYFSIEKNLFPQESIYVNNHIKLILYKKYHVNAKIITKQNRKIKNCKDKKNSLDALELFFPYLIKLNTKNLITQIRRVKKRIKNYS